MINSISSGASFDQMQRPKAEPLTSEQTELMSETLSQFDPENLTAEDAQSIVAAFQEAGIQPGQEMQELMADAGFDAGQGGEMGRPEGGRPPGPPPQGGVEQVNTEDVVSYLDELLADYSEQLSDDDKASILSSVQQQFGLEQSDSLLSVKA